MSGRRSTARGRRSPGRGRSLPPGTAPTGHVDHRHQPGKVRGIPCFNRNSAIGKRGETPWTCRPDCRYVEGNSWEPIPVAPGVYQLPS
ncbi:endonuclease domain-containing protein [Streptomyces sp. NPDC017248]|uniref:endonuclease domain-containing protein n=1 Tax=unclassified Streptomyces TaxID=2593676 RepID=UPI00343422AA